MIDEDGWVLLHPHLGLRRIIYALHTATFLALNPDEMQLAQMDVAGGRHGGEFAGSEK